MSTCKQRVAADQSAAPVSRIKRRRNSSTVLPLSPLGLVNLGRTCSFNVLLQALAAATTLSGIYKQYETLCIDKDAMPFNSHVAMVLRMLLGTSHESGAVAPLDFINQMRSLNEDFKEDTEHDVEEIWRVFLDRLFGEVEAPSMTRNTVVRSVNESGTRMCGGGDVSSSSASHVRKRMRRASRSSTQCLHRFCESPSSNGRDFEFGPPTRSPRRSLSSSPLSSATVSELSHILSSPISSFPASSSEAVDNTTVLVAPPSSSLPSSMTPDTRSRTIELHHFGIEETPGRNNCFTPEATASTTDVQRVKQQMANMLRLALCGEVVAYQICQKCGAVQQKRDEFRGVFSAPLPQRAASMRSTSRRSCVASAMSTNPVTLEECIGLSLGHDRSSADVYEFRCSACPVKSRCAAAREETLHMESVDKRLLDGTIPLWPPGESLAFHDPNCDGFEAMEGTPHIRRSPRLRHMKGVGATASSGVGGTLDIGDMEELDVAFAEESLQSRRRGRANAATSTPRNGGDCSNVGTPGRVCTPKCRRRAVSSIRSDNSTNVSDETSALSNAKKKCYFGKIPRFLMIQLHRNRSPRGYKINAHVSFPMDVSAILRRFTIDDVTPGDLVTPCVGDTMMRSIPRPVSSISCEGMSATSSGDTIFSLSTSPHAKLSSCQSSTPCLPVGPPSSSMAAGHRGRDGVDVMPSMLLRAVIEHQGRGGNQGHYIIFVRDRYNAWWHISDDVVQPSSWDAVERAQAYILVYEADEDSSTAEEGTLPVKGNI